MVSPDPLRTYLEAGLQAHNRGDIEVAAAAYRRALAIAPEHPDALHLLGVALLQLGEVGTAVDFLERAAHKQRNNAAVIGNLAQGYFTNERYAEAHAAFRKASRLDPRNVQFQLGMANCLALQDQHAEAESLLRRLTARFAQHALAWCSLGNVLRDRGRAAEAIDSYQRALELDPQLIDARNNLAGTLHKLLRFEEAEREFRACIERAPDYILARCNLASVLIDLGRFAEAAALCRDVIRQAPDFALAHTYLGAALGHQGQLLDALACHRVAVDLAPRDAKAAQTYGSTLIDCGRFSDGLRSLTRAIALDPQLTSTHLLLGQALLGNGCLAQGWVEYAYRPWPDMFREKYPQIALSRTLPETLDGKHICVVKEQGLGDEIFFLRYVPQLHAAGARISYCASDKIHSMLTRVPAIDEVLGETTPPPADAVILVGDLPLALSASAASPLPDADIAPGGFHAPDFASRISIFVPPVPPPLTLAPVAERLAEIRERLAALGPPPYIGLTWRGGTPPSEQRLVIWALHKEIGIPPLAAALKNVPGTFVALQRKPDAGELVEFANALGRPVHDLSALNEDLEGMLAMLAVLDEYVGVSNTNVHLRASAG
ncbi:MAG: tetratricopeptide repeat protein, partial [Betaproteobacteria bacterium]|nr:tetratricopeptide repeat protein [Betaproteobacteria bacterium]